MCWQRPVLKVAGPLKRRGRREGFDSQAHLTAGSKSIGNLGSYSWGVLERPWDSLPLSFHKSRIVSLCRQLLLTLRRLLRMQHMLAYGRDQARGGLKDAKAGFCRAQSMCLTRVSAELVQIVRAGGQRGLIVDPAGPSTQKRRE